jgi:hypothetical protein
VRPDEIDAFWAYIVAVGGGNHPAELIALGLP